jgi:hypothetical protein
MVNPNRWPRGGTAVAAEIGYRGKERPARTRTVGGFSSATATLAADGSNDRLVNPAVRR